MRKLKVGDEITIKKNLVVGEYYGQDKLFKTMRRFLGKTVTITNVGIKWDRCLVKEDKEQNVWSHEMIEDYIQLNVE